MLILAYRTRLCSSCAQHERFWYWYMNQWWASGITGDGIDSVGGMRGARAVGYPWNGCKCFLLIQGVTGVGSDGAYDRERRCGRYVFSCCNIEHSLTLNSGITSKQYRTWSPSEMLTMRGCAALLATLKAERAWRTRGDSGVGIPGNGRRIEHADVEQKLTV